MQIYKKGDTVDIGGRGTVQKGMPPGGKGGIRGLNDNGEIYNKDYIKKKECPTNVPTAKLEESTVSPSTRWALLSTNKGKILATRINVRIECIKHSKNQDSCLKRVKEDDWKKKEAKKKGAWVQLKYQPAPPREALFVRTAGKEPELLEPIPDEIIARKV